MNRRGFIAGTSASPVTAAVSYTAFIQPGDDQVDELATQVAELDTRVEALETQVAHLHDDNGTADTTPVSEDVIGSATIDGMGTMVSDPFRLSAGRYRMNATVQANNGFASIIVEVFDPSGGSELVINQFGESTGQWTGSTIYNAPADGEYFVSVSNTNGAWSITFEQF